VPQAVVAFLDGVSFEDCIRNAISIGGDSDTLACLTGSIAEAYYGVPSDIREKAMEYLPDELKEIVTEFERKYSSRTSRK
jgi:ADP-ribosylglycohydrolase